jgi:carbon-monoxide dehydrogenase iron sulfur subunit
MKALVEATMEMVTKDRTLRILRDSERCYGCRTCELACSFHHKAVFAPELSSIKVSKSNQTGIVKWDKDSSCDSCVGEEKPQCVKYCFYGALQVVEQP